jgi:hypothetical protein
MEVGMLEIVVTGAAALVSGVGGVLTAQMRAAALRDKDSSAAQQKVIDSVVELAKVTREGTDVHRAVIEAPNGNHGLTHRLLERQEAIAHRHTELLSEIVDGQNKRSDVLKGLTDVLDRVRICPHVKSLDESEKGHEL